MAPPAPNTSLADHLIAALGCAMAALLFAMMMITVVDVIGRYLLNAPLPGAVELTELSMGALVFGALPLATRAREHITIDLVDFMMSDRVKRVRSLVVDLVAAVLLAFLAWRLWARGLELASYGDRSSYLQIPLSPFAFFMAAMAATAAIVLLMLAAAPRATAKGDTAAGIG